MGIHLFGGKHPHTNEQGFINRGQHKFYCEFHFTATVKRILPQMVHVAKPLPSKHRLQTLQLQTLHLSFPAAGVWCQSCLIMSAADKSSNKLSSHQLTWNPTFGGSFKKKMNFHDPVTGRWLAVGSLLAGCFVAQRCPQQHFTNLPHKGPIKQTTLQPFSHRI